MTNQDRLPEFSPAGSNNEIRTAPIIEEISPELVFYWWTIRVRIRTAFPQFRGHPCRSCRSETAFCAKREFTSEPDPLRLISDRQAGSQRPS